MNATRHHIFCLILMLFMTACAPQAPTLPQEILRPDPGVINWLQRQSFLYHAENNTRTVSGSHLGWTLSEQNTNANLFRDAALWLEINPYHILNETPFEMLANQTIFSSLQDIGFTGLYLSPLTEITASEQPYAPMTIEDSSSYSLTTMGEELDLAVLRDLALTYKIWFGTDALSTSIALASDMDLAARAVSPWESAFIMIDIPKDAWHVLPRTGSENKTDLVLKPLTKRAHNYLVTQGIMPHRLLRDTARWLSPSKWVVSNALVGVDGQTRRWLIRKQVDFDRAVLHLGDPSGTARRIISGSVLQNMGVRQLPLLGFDTATAFGNTPSNMKNADLLDPGVSYIREIHSLIKGYGGFSLLRTAMPLEFLARVQEQGPDAILDSVTSPGLEIALLTGNTLPLKTALTKSLATGVEHNRLWHPVSQEQGILLPLALGADSPDLRTLAWHDIVYYDGQRLVATVPALAAMRLGIIPENVRDTKNKADIMAVHKSILAFRAALPGILSISAQDVLGITHAPLRPENSFYPFPAWTWDNTPRAVTQHGVPKGQALYDSIQTQLQDQNSFLSYVKRLARLRTNFGIPDGTISAIVDTANPAVVAYIIQTNTQRMMVLMSFSKTNTRLTLPSGTSYRNAFTNGSITNNTISFTPFETKWLLLNH